MIERKKYYWALKKKITAANKQIDMRVYELLGLLAQIHLVGSERGK